jgi:glycosyltransferase involved in cell wall biosynthesis
MLRGLSKDRKFIVASPLGQTYSQRFSNYANVVELPYRRFSFFSLFALANLIRRENIGVIHSHGKGAGIYSRLLGRLTGRPVIHTFHGFHYRNLAPVKRSIYLAAERLLAGYTTVLLNVSLSEQSACVEAGVVAKQRNVVIPNGVPVPARWTNPLARPDRKRLILINVARHEREKGVDGVLRVVHELDMLGVEFELWLVGDGEQNPELKAQAAADGLSDKVRFLGFRDDVPLLLQAADIFVSASHGEGMPLTLLEAMGAGLPSVASDVAGNHDVIENGETGFLYPLDQPKVAAESIARLAGDNDLFAHCSRTSHARALERYSVEVMCERIADVYDSINVKND